MTRIVTNPTGQKMSAREEVRQELWSAQLKSPTFALSEALHSILIHVFR